MNTTQNDLDDQKMKQLRSLKPRAREAFRMSLRTRVLESAKEQQKNYAKQSPYVFIPQLFTNHIPMHYLKRGLFAAPVVALAFVLITMITMPSMDIAQAEEIVRQNPQVQALLEEGASIAHVELTNGGAEVTLSPAYFVQVEENVPAQHSQAISGTATATNITELITDHKTIQWTEITEVEGVDASTISFEGVTFTAVKPTDFVKAKVDFESREVVNLYAIPATNTDALEGIELISETAHERVYELPGGKTIRVHTISHDAETATIFFETSEE